MSARFLEQEGSIDNIILEDGTGTILIEDATLTVVFKTFTYKYDIVSFISKAFTYLYDITGTVFKTFTYMYDINDNGSTVMEDQYGTITPTHLASLNNEIYFITKTDGLRHYSLYIFVDQMQAVDEIKVRFQIKDPVSNTWKDYDKEAKIAYNDINGDTAPFEVFIPARAFRVGFKQTKGTLRSYNWHLIKSK